MLRSLPLRVALHCAAAVVAAPSGEFHAVHYFVGANETSVPAHRPGDWHSQSTQDRLVGALLGWKRGGFFVDLAANDPVDLSNTYSLEHDYGWHGVCIDGNVELLPALARHRACHVVGAVVSTPTKVVSFRRFHGRYTGRGFVPHDSHIRSVKGHGLSGIVSFSADAPHRLKANHTFPEDSAAAPVDEVHTTVGLDTILRRIDAPRVVDYLSLDVEGAEMQVLGNFPFDAPFSFRVLTIEEPKAPLKAVLRQHGFTPVLYLGTDELWIHEGHLEMTVAHARDVLQAECARAHAYKCSSIL